MKKLLAIAAILASTLGLAVVQVSADHAHSIKVGNGACVVLDGEGHVILPGYEDQPENRRHPLHVKVHKARAGENFEIGVYNTPSDPCYESGEYLNPLP